MSQYAKKCLCGAENADNASFCLECEADLTGVRPHKLDHSVTTSDQPIPTESMSAPLTEQSQDNAVICPACDATNEYYLILCSSCGAELAAKSLSAAPRNEVVKNEPESTKIPDNKLMIVVGNLRCECKDGDVLGRAGTVACQIFSGIGTVSGRHVSVSIRSGEWWLTNLQLQPGKSVKNATIVDGRELAIGDSVRLSKDTMLQMSTKCTVRLQVV
jgi:hypothetical protein